MQNSTSAAGVTNAKAINRWILIMTTVLIALLSSFNSFSQTTLLIDPAGDGGFNNGITFASNGWSLDNSVNNPWVVGTGVATAPFSGRSAYVSSNGGTSNTYNTGTIAVNYFWRDITIPAGQPYLSYNFNWVSNGESTWDLIQLFVAPTTVTPASTVTYPGSGLSTTNMVGATFINSFNLQTTIQSGGGVIVGTPGTTVRVIFCWKNDGGGGTVPGGSLDNISLVSSVSRPSISATANGGLWSSPATWVGGIVPSGADAVIPAGSIVTVDQLTSVNDMSLSGTLQWNGSSNAMTITGSLTVNAGGNFLPYTTGSTGQTVNIAGNFTNNGYSNCAFSGTLINFNVAGSTLDGTGTFQGDGTNGIIRTLAFQNLGSNTINTSQNIITSGLTHTGGSLNTNGKLKIDNTAQVYGLPLNLQVPSVAVTAMGSLYNAAPVVFGASVIQYANALSATANSRYVSGGNVYLCTNAGTFNATPPTSTTPATTFTTSGPTLLYLGPVGQLGNPFQVTAVTAGTQYFYNGNLYTCTVAGTPTAVTAPTHVSGTAASGTATFLYVGTPATASVNYDATTQTVRSLNLTSSGTGYVSAPAIAFSVGVVAGTGSGASATAVFLQQIIGPANSLTQKSGGAATISGAVTINSDQGASIASADPQASTGVGALSTSGGGLNYTVAPTVGFALPPALNLITNQGSGYIATPTVTVTGGNLVSGTALTTANFTITVNQGRVESVYLNTATTATYSTLPTLSLTASPGVTATLAFPAGCLPVATANIGANRQITSFTITNAGYGYQAAPIVGIGTTSGTANGGTFTTVATAPTARVALYSLTLNFFIPALSAVVNADDAAIPTNRKMNNLTLAGNGNGINLSGNLTIFGTSPLSLTASASVPGNIIDLGGNTLAFTWNGYAGATATFGATNTFIKNGSMSVTGRGGASTFNFPFSGQFNWFAGSTPTSVTTGSTVTKVTVTETGAPSGPGAIGTRSFLVNNNGGTQGLNPTVTMNYNTVDALPVAGNATDLYIAQSTVLTGGWIERSVSSGSGTVGTSGTRTTGGVAPGPLVPTGLDYVAWSSVRIDTANVTIPTPACPASSHVINADITTTAGVITTVTLNYAVNGVAQAGIAMTNSSGNTWTATIPVTAPTNATVTWSITAVNSLGITKAVTGTSYADEPLTGATIVASAVPASVCAGSPSVVTAQIKLAPGNSQIGSGTTVANNTTAFSSGQTFYGTWWGNARQQWLIRASELNAAGVQPGNMNSLSINVNALGSPTSLTGFTIKIGATASTTITTAYLTPTFTTVWGPTNYTPAVGLNTHTFTTPFNWDGTSNIVVEVCHANSATGSTSATNTYTAPGFTCAINYGADGAGGAGACTTATITNNTQPNRPNIMFIGSASYTLPGAVFTWNDGASNIGTGNPFTVNPLTTTTYSVSAANASGCAIGPSAGVTVTAIPLPAAPGANSSTQCGVGVPAAFVTGAFGNFKWYSAQTGGTLLQTGGATYTSSISSTTHFWVSQNDGTCESLRSEVIATVNTPDPISASSDGPVCAGSNLTLTATVTSGTNGNNYTYTWAASPASGSGIPTTTAGGTGTFGSPADKVVTPTTAGTYTYTVTGVDGSCTAVSTVVVTVKALPQINATTATPSVICAGTNVTLNGTSGTQASGPVQVGAGATTITGATTSLGSPYNNWYGGIKQQMIYRKSELNALGMSAGNITALSFDLSAVSSTILTMANFTINIGHTTQTASVNPLIVTGLTQVYSNASQGVNVGLNTYTFSTPFNWNNTDNIVVSICFSNVNSGSTANQPTIRVDAASFNATAYIYADNTTAAALFTATSNTSPGVGGTSQTAVTTTRPKTVFTAITGVNTTGSMNWSWNPGSLSGSTVIVNPSITTTYTVTATDPVTTCSASNTVTVTVNPLPPAPSAADGTDRCGTGLSDMSVSSNNVTDPQVPPFFKWYDAPTGGVLKQSGTSTTYNTAISATTTLYVAEVSLNGCEGPRSPITTVVSSPDPITVNATSTSICLGVSFDLSTSYTPDFNSFATFDLTATGGSASGVTGTVSLFPNATGSDPYTITPTATGTYTYTVVAFDPDKGCTAINTVVVTVKPNPAITSSEASPAAICNGASSTLTALTGSSAQTTVQIGSGTATVPALTTIGALYGGYYGNGHAQILIKASELTALGFLPGNLTSLSIDISALPSGAAVTHYPGYTIKLGTVSAATTTISTFQSPTFTTVYGPTDYTPFVGNNTHSFIAPYAWDGVSNIIVDYCFEAGLFGSIGSPTNTTTTTTFGSFVNYQVDNPQGGTVCANTTVSNASSIRPNVKFTGLVGTSGPGPYSWTWNPGNLNGNVQTVSPSSSATYTVTATLNGCSTIGTPVTVTVNPLPAAPSTNSPVTRCGIGSVTLTATGSGGPLKWYNVATGGTSLFTGGSYTTNVTTSTSFWVSETSEALCEGPRSEVVVTVTTPPTLAITPSGATTFCQGGSVTLNGATGSDPSYVNFTWSPSPLPGSGLSSTTGASITVTPTVSGTYTITLNANDGGSGPTACANTTTVVVTMNPNPTITTAVATPPTICNGGNSVLSATSVNAVTGVAQVGAEASVNITPSPYRGGSGSDCRNQMIYTAAELIAAGIAPGPITSIAFNNTTTPSTAVNQLTISIGATSATSLGTTYDASPTTAVWGPINFIPALGVNTHTFSSAFIWDGVSSIIVNTCSPGGAGTSYNVSIGSVAGRTIQTAASGACTATTGTSFNQVVARFGGQIGTDVTNTLQWVWQPGALAGPLQTVNPSTTTSYTVTATNPGTGCFAVSSPVTVTVQPVGANATATPSTPVCLGTSVTLNAGATGGGPFTYSWNDGASNFSTDAAPVVTPTATTTYTVTVTDVCGNPTTSSVTVTVLPLPSVSVSPLTANFCNPGGTPVALTASGDAVSYAWTPTAGVAPTTGLNVNASPSVTTTYTVTGTGANGCTKTATTVITVNPNVTGAAASVVTTPICQGATLNLTASANPIPGYTMNANSGVSFTDISGTGTSVGTLGDDTEHSISLPSVPFNGTVYTTGVVGTNGVLLLGVTTGDVALTNTTLPSTANVVNTFLAPWWDDLDIQTGAVIYTQTIGNEFIVQFNNMTHNDFTTGSVTFEIKMNIVTGVISYVYPDVSFGNVTQDAGLSATVGLQTSSTNANQYSFNTASLVNNQSITFTPTALSYSWNGPNSFTSLVQNPSIPNAQPAASGTYTVTITTNLGCAVNVITNAATVNPRPTAAISGTGAFCQNAANTSTNLTVNFTGTAPWNYTYTVDGGSPVSGTTSSNPLTIAVAPSSASPHVFTYEISALSDANCASIAADLSGSGTVTINPLAASPTAVVSVQPTCAVGTGTVTVTAPLGTGNSYTLDGTTTINWPTVSFTGVTPGPHTITVANSFGCSAPASTSVTVDPQPFIPGTPVVTGIVNVCPYIGVVGVAGQVTYHATATGNGTQVFNWVIPTTNVTIVSGQGTADLVLTFQNGFAAQANKQLRLTVTNQCGTSSMTIYYLLAQFPNTPNPITGPTNVCTLIGTATTATYTTNKAAGALFYNWTVPANATIVGHPGGAGTANDTSIVVTFQAGFAGGNVTVVAENVCGPSGARTLAIVNAVPSTPGLISGPTNACPATAPTGVAATYSIVPVPFATSYTWTTPVGTVVTHPNGAGPNDYTITVLYPVGFTSGSITVKATNGCGTGGVRSLSITKLNPATPSVIDVVQTRFCGDPLGRAYTYALASMPANATAVVWTIPAGATSVNITPIKIEVTYPITAVNGFVTAQATNASCVSTIRSSEVKLPACPPPGFAAGKGETLTAPLTKAMEVRIFPNPTVSDFKLQVLTSGSEEITVRVLDNLGRLYKSFKMMPYQTIALGAELKAGSYMVEVRQGAEVKTSKVIKF